MTKDCMNKIGDIIKLYIKGNINYDKAWVDINKTLDNGFKLINIEKDFITIKNKNIVRNIGFPKEI